jgi:hypothetical protein
MSLFLSTAASFIWNSELDFILCEDEDDDACSAAVHVFQIILAEHIDV